MIRNGLKSLAGVLAGALILSSPEADAAGYIKFDGIDGEANGNCPRCWIDTVSVSQVVIRPGGAGDCSLGAATTDEPLVVVKPMDGTSAALRAAACDGRTLPSVRLRVDSPGAGTPDLEYELQDVIISSYSIGAAPSASGELVPVESLTLTARSVDIQITSDRDR